VVHVTDRLCVFAAPHVEDAKGDIAHSLREGGLTLWPWPPTPPDAQPPAAFDALLVLTDTSVEVPAAARAQFVVLLRSAWLRGATIGLFGSDAAALLAAADIAPEGTPIDAEGLFTGTEAPAEGTLQEFLDAVDGGPHTGR
jgi:hypothetical protein